MVFDYIKDHLNFDQLIYEYGTDANPDWVHVSYESTGKQRKQILKAVKSAKGTSYLLMGAEEDLPDFISEIPDELNLPKATTVPKLTEWQTLYIAAGKKDKINKMDIVGMLCQKGKLVKTDLGLIEVLDHSSYVAVKRDKIEAMLRLIRHEKIKAKSVRMEISK